MLFKRKYKQSLWLKIREMIWPSSGWKRSFIYIKHRVLRLPHSTHDIAMGLSAGCVVSFTPTWGFQILQCFVFCKVVRANFLASVLGTTFGNPWTFPIFMWVSYMVGDYFLNITGLENYLDIIGAKTVLSDGEEHDVNAFIPMLVGGYIMAVVGFPVFYYSFYYVIEGARAARVKVRTKVHDIKEHRKEKKKK